MPVVPVVVEEAPSFSVAYTSPVDTSTVVQLTCKESVKAKATAICNGNYTTVPLAGVTEGFEVKVQCEIKFGAISGPGCITVVDKITGPGTEKTYTQYLEPPVCCGPAHLKTWDQQYLTFLREANSELYATLITPQPTNSEPAMGSDIEADSGSRDDESSDDRELRSMLNEMLTR